MDWYEAEVRAMEQARMITPPQTGVVVFYGSSSIRLWSSLREDFPGVEVVNAGFGGSTMAACAVYFERLVVPFQPRSLVVYAGDNDLGDGQHPEAVLASFRSLLQKMQALGPVPFAFISIKPSPARWHLLNLIQQTNALIRQEMALRPHSYYVDVSPVMLNEKGEPRHELYQEDGLHLSATGYQVWTQILLTYRAELFDVEA